LPGITTGKTGLLVVMICILHLFVAVYLDNTLENQISHCALNMVFISVSRLLAS
jgi:hypothetical protein